MTNEVRRFFDDFVEAFPSFRGEQIAERYLVPYMAIQADGSTQVHPSQEAISSYFQAVLNDYRDRRCIGCRYADLEVQEMGRGSVLGTVTWELLGAHGSVLSRWRESYVLVRDRGYLKVRASVDHAQ